MKQVLIFVFIICSFNNILLGQSKNPDYDNAIRQFKKIQKWVATDDIEALSKHIIYPLQRFGELKSIKNVAQFNVYYRTLFDSGVKAQIKHASLDSNYIYYDTTSGYFSFDRSYIWITPEGMISSILYDSDKEVKINERESEKIKAKIHPSVTDWYSYGRIIYVQSDKYIIRVHSTEEGYEYNSWSKPKTIEDKPDFTLKQKNKNNDFTFKDNNLTYSIEGVSYIEHDNIKLIIYQNDKEIANIKLKNVN